MAPSTIRWAIGAMKDQASMALVKVKSSISPELDVAIIKATGHGDDPAEEKHVREILFIASSSRAHVSTCVTAVASRLSKTQDWIVALKALMLIHRLLADGDPCFHLEFHRAVNPRCGTPLLHLSDFRDQSHSSSWVETAFVRAYSLYLDQRIQCMLYETKQRRVCDDVHRGLPDSNYGEFYADWRQPSANYREHDMNLQQTDSNYREFESHRKTNSLAFNSNDRVSKFADANWRSPNLNYREFDSYRGMNSRPSESNYRASKFRDDNSNYREFDTCGEMNSGYPKSNYRDHPNWRSPNSNHGEFDPNGSYESYVDAPDRQQQPPTPLPKMKTERILGRLQELQVLLDRLLMCRPTGTATIERMVIVALYPVVKESFQLYADISELLTLVLDRFFNMDYPICAKVFEAYSWAAKQIDELISFYGWCKNSGVGRSSEYPEVERVSGKMLATMEVFVRDCGRKPGSPKREGRQTFGEEVKDPVPDSLTVKALPSPENFNEKEEKTEDSAKTEQHQQKEIEADLLNLKENISPEDQSNRLALALFSVDGSFSTSKNGSSWETFPAKTELQEQEGGKEDWEIALVESASNLSRQRASLGGGMDPLLLNGMYDQGAINQYMDAQMNRGGSSSSVTLPVPGKTPVLALPAPDGTVQAVGWDPFEASLSIPPPAYVQMADVERKQRLMVEEQLMWEQYNRDGMQGQVSLERLSGNCYDGVGRASGPPFGIRPVRGGGTNYYSPY